MIRALTVAAFTVCMPAALLVAQDATQNAAAERQESSPGDLKELVGEYQIVEGAKDGEKVPAERLKDNAVAITRDTIAVVDPERKELYSARYKVGKKNEDGIWQINMTSKSPKEGAPAVGLLKRDGEQLWLIYDLNGKRPSGFDKTTAGQHLFKMTRKADKSKANGSADQQ